MDALIQMFVGGVVTTSLLALCIWFITRYISQRDDFEKKVEDKIASLPEKFSKEVARVELAARAMSQEVIKMKETSSSLQTRVAVEVAKVGVQVAEIAQTVSRTSEKALKLEEQLDVTIKATTTLNERLTHNDKVMSAIVQQVRATKADVDDYKTFKKQIGEDVVILKKKISKSEE